MLPRLSADAELVLAFVAGCHKKNEEWPTWTDVNDQFYARLRLDVEETRLLDALEELSEAGLLAEEETSYGVVYIVVATGLSAAALGPRLRPSALA